jgi:hypothetical protein
MVLKNRYVPELLTSYLNLLFFNKEFEQCLSIMDYITHVETQKDKTSMNKYGDKQGGEDMQVDQDMNMYKRRSGFEPSSVKSLSLKPYLDTKAMHAIDRQLSDVMSQDLDIVEYLLN